jgi:hypothetical protein
LEAVPFGTLARDSFAIVLNHSNNVDKQDDADESSKDVVQDGNTKIGATQVVINSASGSISGTNGVSVDAQTTALAPAASSGGSTLVASKSLVARGRLSNAAVIALPSLSALASNRLAVLIAASTAVGTSAVIGALFNGAIVVGPDGLTNAASVSAVTMTVAARIRTIQELAPRLHPVQGVAKSLTSRAVARSKDALSTTEAVAEARICSRNGNCGS